jgi:hypothetical protein
MAFVKATAGKTACASQVTASGVGGFMGALGGTAGGGKIKAYQSDHTTLLATWTLPALTNSGGGLITMSGTAPVATPVANGVAAIYDLCTSGDTVLGSGTITATGGGGDLTFNNTTFATTSNVTLATWTHQEN